MRFAPKTEEEAKQGSLLNPKGECDFEVKQAEDKISNTGGNEMIALVMEVYDSEGKKATVKDYLLESTPAKLRGFCYATGLESYYEAGTLTADRCHGRSGRLKIRHEIDGTGQYPPKNVVAEYVAVAPAPRQHQPARQQPAAPVPANAAPNPTKAAMSAAWAAFNASMPGAPAAGIAADWKEAVKNFLPHKSHDLWTAEEWRAFAGNDFKPKQVANPIGEVAEFADADIPF